MIPAGFILKVYRVHVSGFSAALYDSASPGKARAEAWRAYSEWRGTSFRDFLKISRVEKAVAPEEFGQPIVVCGLPAFRCLGLHGQYIRFVRPFSETILLSHPLDVEVGIQ